jgi:glycosyltransferase involved in cell wall biosynthesis
MPNKLFHAIALGVPVVATDVGELGAVVREHGIGTLYRPGDSASLVDAISDARARYAELVAAVSRSRDALSWTADRAVLQSVYDDLLQGERAR